MELSYLDERMDQIEEKIDLIDTKIEILIKLIDTNIKPNCEKMNDHINFIEKIYENVKNPLGFFCNFINFHITDEFYTLET